MNYTLHNADCAEGFGGRKSLELVSFFGWTTHWRRNHDDVSERCRVGIAQVK